MECFRLHLSTPSFCDSVMFTVGIGLLISGSAAWARNSSAPVCSPTKVYDACPAESKSDQGSCWVLGWQNKNHIVDEEMGKIVEGVEHINSVEKKCLESLRLFGLPSIGWTNRHFPPIHWCRLCQQMRRGHLHWQFRCEQGRLLTRQGPVEGALPLRRKFLDPPP